MMTEVTLLLEVSGARSNRMPERDRQVAEGVFEDTVEQAIKKGEQDGLAEEIMAGILYRIAKRLYVGPDENDYDLPGG
jgi:hypothetical protein